MTNLCIHLADIKELTEFFSSRLHTVVYVALSALSCRTIYKDILIQLKQQLQ